MLITGRTLRDGFLRPSVYLPEDFEDQFDVSERKCIVHHELMHFSRRDIWMQAAWKAIRTVFWFDPIIHIAATALQDDQELNCDHGVLIAELTSDFTTRERFSQERDRFFCHEP